MVRCTGFCSKIVSFGRNENKTGKVKRGVGWLSRAKREYGAYYELVIAGEGLHILLGKR